MPKPKVKRLTPKERLFCKRYLGNGYNGSEAVRFAGYSEKAAKEKAYSLFTKSHIKEFIALEIRRMEEKLEITAEWKMKILKQCIDACLSGEASENKVHPTGVIGAIAELNKMQGHYVKEKQSDPEDRPKAVLIIPDNDRDVENK